MDPRTRLAEVEGELRQLHETAGDQPLTGEQQTRWDELTTERTQLTETIRRDDERRALVRDLGVRPGATESGDGATGAPQHLRRVDPYGDGADVRYLRPADARSRALKVLETSERDGTGEHLDDAQRARVEKLVRASSDNTQGDQIARRLLITERPEYRSAFQKAVTQTVPLLNADEQRALEELRAASIGTDSAGGFGVPVLIDPTIVLTAQGHPNPFFRISRVETITTDEWKGVSSAGVTWSFDGEAAEVSDDTPTLAQPNVVTKKAQGFIPYSIEVGQDYPGFATEMSRLLGEGYSELLVEKFTTGTGTLEPFGIVTALDANTNVEVTPTTDGAFGAVDVYKVWAALPIRYRGRASWMYSQDVENRVRQFGVGSTADANFTVSLTAGEIPALFNRPVEINDYMPTFSGTTGAANILIVGDFSNYLIAQRAGMSVELIPHLFATANNRPSGQRGWYAYSRLGADSINDLGFRLLQNQ